MDRHSFQDTSPSAVSAGVGYLETARSFALPQHPAQWREARAAGSCASQVLCLRTAPDTPGCSDRAGVDIDTLGQQLRASWIARTAGVRRPVRVEVSCVESCAETRQERERDARRLIELESDAHRGGGLAQSLRATLVSLDPGEYLLLLAAPAAASAATLAGLIDELAKHYRLSPV